MIFIRHFLNYRCRFIFIVLSGRYNCSVLLIRHHFGSFFRALLLFLIPCIILIFIYHKLFYLSVANYNISNYRPNQALINNQLFISMAI